MLNITVDHYSLFFCYFLQINEVHRNGIWRAYQAIGGATIKTDKTKRGKLLDSEQSMIHGEYDG